MLTFTYHGYFGEIEPDESGGWSGTLLTDSGDVIPFSAPEFALLHHAVREQVREYLEARDALEGK